ncbi:MULTISPECIES: hypothetical protein [unclassified Raoultella]|uniref:hypothetical protein n=1 Tax=unclassified Raoultella TaxID=2627600 RepID=UPI001D115DE8|nr:MULTISPECIES: hypothetical protein [unclassified Raoultella]
MTSKLTREQAEDTIEGLEGLIGRGVRSVYLDMAITGMRQLMAALDSEPAAYIVHAPHGDTAYRTISPRDAEYIKRKGYTTEPLYRHAQPAPVVQKTAHSSVIAEQLAHVLSGMEVTDHQRAVISCAVDRLNNVAQLLQLSPSALLVPEILDYQGAKELYNYLMTEEETNATVNGWNACRAAMLQAAPVRSSMPDGGVTAEHRRVIEMLLNVCGAAFELADDSCQQDVDGEDCHVVPDDAFQKLSDALDEIENTLPTEDIDRPDVFLAWSAMPRAALKSILQAGNSPVIPGCDGAELMPSTGEVIDPASGPDRSVEVRYFAPPGYVMVPKEPTERMVIAGFESEPDEGFSELQVWEAYEDMSGCEQAAYRARLCWAAMLAAAPQEVK